MASDHHNRRAQFAANNDPSFAPFPSLVVCPPTLVCINSIVVDFLVCVCSVRVCLPAWMQVYNCWCAHIKIHPMIRIIRSCGDLRAHDLALKDRAYTGWALGFWNQKVFAWRNSQDHSVCWLARRACSDERRYLRGRWLRRDYLVRHTAQRNWIPGQV